MADHIATGQQLANKAEKKLFCCCALFGSNYEDAAELFLKSAKSFKLGKSCKFLFNLPPFFFLYYYYFFFAIFLIWHHASESNDPSRFFTLFETINYQFKYLNFWAFIKFQAFSVVLLWRYYGNFQAWVCWWWFGLFQGTKQVQSSSNQLNVIWRFITMIFHTFFLWEYDICF